MRGPSGRRCTPSSGGAAEVYRELFRPHEARLAERTGFAAVSLQPPGSQGEYAELLVIRGLHRGRGETERGVCLIPISADGTTAASAAMASLRVVSVTTPVARCTWTAPTLACGSSSAVDSG